MKSQLLSFVGGASLKFSSLKSQSYQKKKPEHFNDDRCIWQSTACDIAGSLRSEPAAGAAGETHELTVTVGMSARPSQGRN